MLFVVDDALAFEIGFDNASFLSRAKYWLCKCGKEITGESGKWIYNTFSDWTKQFPWSKSKIHRITEALESAGVLIKKKLDSKRWNHTLWYSIDEQKLSELETKARRAKTYKTKKSKQATDKKDSNSVFSTSVEAFIDRANGGEDGTEKVRVFKSNKEEDSYKDKVQEMVKIWNRYTDSKENTSPSQFKYQSFYAFLRDHFDLSPDRWGLFS